MRRTSRIILLSAALVLGLEGRAHAGGFMVDTHDARGTGRGFANTAGVDDASALYFNPAAIGSFEGNSLRAGFHYLTYRIAYDPAPGAGSEARTQREHAILPHTFGSLDLSEHVDLGLGVYVPFALATQWPRGWTGRYQALKNEVGFTYIQPAVAVTLPFGDGIHLGAGPLFVWQSSMKPVRLNRALDFRFLGEPDGELVIEGASDQVEVGYTVSFLWAPKEVLGGRVRVGAAWHDTPGKHQITGEAEFRNVPLALGFPFETDARTDLTLPGWLQAGIQVEVIENTLWVELDYKWVQWSKLEELRIRFPHSPVPTSTLEFQWRDTHMVMVGVSVQPVKGLMLNAGYFFDQTPVPGHTVSPLLPDSDRHGVSFGVGFRVGPARFDLSYMHLFMQPRDKFNALGQDSPGGPATANGTYEQIVDLVGVSVGLDF